MSRRGEIRMSGQGVQVGRMFEIHGIDPLLTRRCAFITWQVGAYPR
jgi:hypothetical protein